MTTDNLVFEHARGRLALALLHDHLYGCTDNTCDIRMAADLGLQYRAARALLDGTTEAPRVRAELAKLPGWEQYERYEFGLFAPWFAANTVECPGCGGYVQFGARATGSTIAAALGVHGAISPERPAQVTCSNCLTLINVPERI